MFLAVALAILFRVNVPASFLLIWITNPLTIPPIFFGTYKLGAWMMDIPPKQIQFELSLDTLISLQHIWKPLFLGSFVTALVAALVGFFVTRLLWRMHIISRMKQRFHAARSRS